MPTIPLSISFEMLLVARRIALSTFTKKSRVHKASRGDLARRCNDCGLNYLAVKFAHFTTKPEEAEACSGSRPRETNDRSQETRRSEKSRGDLALRLPFIFQEAVTIALDLTLFSQESNVYRILSCSLRNTKVRLNYACENRFWVYQHFENMKRHKLIQSASFFIKIKFSHRNNLAEEVYVSHGISYF